MSNRGSRFKRRPIRLSRATPSGSRPAKYREAVCIVGKGLTIIGAGRNRTTILPPRLRRAQRVLVVDTPADGRGQPPEDGYSALHFEDPDRRVTVTRLSTEGHPGSGIVAHGASGFTVTNTSGTGHGLYGIWRLRARPRSGS